MFSHFLTSGGEAELTLPDKPYSSPIPSSTKFTWTPPTSPVSALFQTVLGSDRSKALTYIFYFKPLLIVFICYFYFWLYILFCFCLSGVLVSVLKSPGPYLNPSSILKYRPDNVLSWGSSRREVIDNSTPHYTGGCRDHLELVRVVSWYPWHGNRAIRHYCEFVPR